MVWERISKHNITFIQCIRVPILCYNNERYSVNSSKSDVSLSNACITRTTASTLYVCICMVTITTIATAEITCH